MFGLRICKRNRLSLIRAIVIFVCLCAFVFLLKNIENFTIDEDRGSEVIELDGFSLKQSDFDAPLANIFTERGKENYLVPKKDMVSTENPIKSNNVKPIGSLDTYENLAELRETVKRLNTEQSILNLHQFPKRGKSSIVIVVQVHKRSNYLMKLIESLRKAKGISDALLVISHDYYATEINNIVRGIDFCQVLQIFFPYSQQLHPDKFPGMDPNDCPRDISKSQAHQMHCNNAEHPDMYGHYREVKFTMTKHHWWWKANRVFNELRSTQSHDGLVLFLEEDHYVVPDFYEVLKKAYSLKRTDSRCNEHGCEIITLGDYKQVKDFKAAGSQVLRIQPWRSTENNMGMAFDRRTWKKLMACSKMFCTYDDYNWDWTLMRVSLRCLKKQLTVLLFNAPRVFHLGTCGLHHKDSNCNIQTVLDLTQDVIDTNKDVLDPQSLEIELARPWIQGHFGQPNGGWGDVRDHELCMNFTKSTD